MKLSLSRFSILRQMLIGYMPVLVILAILGFLSFKYFKQFDENFLQLQSLTAEDRIFLEIQRDIVELQRNVAVYSYLGYQGIIKKVEFLEQSLEEKLRIIQPIVQSNPELNTRVARMKNHFIDYKNGFDEAIIESNLLSSINKDYVNNLYLVQQSTLQEIDTAFLELDDYEAAYTISQMQHHLLQVKSRLTSFQVSPDGLLLKEAESLLSLTEEKGSQLLLKNNNADLSVALQKFIGGMSSNHQALKNIERVNRSYLQLFNVVLAGKAAEIDKLSVEILELNRQRSLSLGNQIQANVRNSKTQFVILSLVIGFLGLLSSIVIAMGIANPVSAMAKTLSKLATGKTGIEIPGLSRQDEVGQMAKAANEFKSMAAKLQDQTEELEEFSYRTSHDLRSPLVSAIALLNAADNSIRSDDKPQTLKILELATSSLTKLDLLVRDILQLTKVKNEEEENEEIDLEGIIQDSLEKLTHINNFNCLKIKTSLNFKGKLYTKKTRITLIIENLISNAVKYQDLNKDNSFVEISTSQHNDLFVLSVKDNGLGVPYKQRGKVFSMFKRFHPKVSFGSGLGLYMIKKSAYILGGDIHYEDTGEGSLFKLVIPTEG